MDHLEGAVAEVDDVPLLEDAFRVSGLHMVFRLVPALRLADEHLVGGVMRKDQVVLRIGEDRRFRRMHGAVAELMVAADVVEMGVARDTGNVTFGDQRHVPAQAEMAEAGIEQQVAVAASHMPDVAAEEGLDPRLVDQSHAIGEAQRFIPFGRADAEVHGVQSLSTIACGASMASDTFCPVVMAVSAGRRASTSTPLARAVTRLKAP